MPDFSGYKIPIIAGINSNPVGPNENDSGRGPNGSYFTEKYNALIDALSASTVQSFRSVVSFSELEEASSPIEGSELVYVKDTKAFYVYFNGQWEVVIGSEESRSEFVSGYLPYVQNQVYPLFTHPSKTHKILKLYIKVVSASGSATASVLVNGAAATGFNSVTINTTGAVFTASTDVLIPAGQQVGLQFSAVNTEMTVEFTLEIAEVG